MNTTMKTCGGAVASVKRLRELAEPDYPVAIDAIREIRRGARWGHVQLPAEAVVRS